MATSAQETKAEQVLTKWIENEHRVVTHRELAREVACHVDIAKALLASFHASHTCTATYILSGPLQLKSQLLTTHTQRFNGSGSGGGEGAEKSLAHLSATQKIRVVDMDERSEGEVDSEFGDEDVLEGGEGNGMEGLGVGVGTGEEEEGGVEPEKVGRWGVVLTDEEGLEEKKTLFITVGVHIYALSPARISDPGRYIQPNLRSRGDYNNPSVYGTITGTGAGGGVGAGAGVGAGGKMRDGAMDWGQKKEDMKGSKKEEVKKDTKKDEGKKETKGEVKVQGKNETKKTQVEAKVKAEPAEPTVKAEPDVPKSRTSTASTTLRKQKRVITSDDEDEASTSNEPTPTAASGKAAAAAAASGTTGKPKNALGQTSSMVREDEAAMEAMMGMDMDVDLDAEVEGKKGRESVKREGESGKKAEGVRKRRKVKKSKMVQDEKGYMVTTDYFTDESYSGSEDEASKSKPAAAVAVKKEKTQVPTQRTGSSSSIGGGSGSGGGGGSGKSGAGSGAGAKRAAGQTSLAGFFKKKT